MTLPNFAFPQTNYNFVDQNGAITTPWLQLLQNLFYRTGGAVPDTPSDSGVLSIMSGATTDVVSQNDVEDSKLIGLMQQGFSKPENAGFPLCIDFNSPQPHQQDAVLMAKALENDPISGDASRSYATKAITVGASPFSYTAPSNGSVFVTGGTVSAIAFSRDGTTFLATELTTGIIPVRKKDIVRVTYSVAPTMTFVPM